MRDCFDLIALANTLQDDKNSPWADVLIVRTLIDLEDCISSITALLESQTRELEDLKKAYAVLNNRYSELQYLAKSSGK